MSDTRPPRRSGARRLGGLAGAIVDATVQGVDIDAALAGVDVDDLLDRVDVNAVLDRVDVNRLLDRVDVDRLLDHVDVNRLLDTVDVNRLLDRVDPDRLLDRVDPDRLLDRVDVERLVARAGIAEIVASSTGAVAGRGLDTVRRQIVGLDVILMRLLYTLTGRDTAKVPIGPGERTATGELQTPDMAGVGAPAEMSGHYAGLLTQALAVAGDLSLATTLYTLFLTLVASAVTTIFGVDLAGASQSGPLFVGGLLAWLALYLTGTLGIQGRTPVMALLGLRLVTRTGGEPRPRRILAWVVALPLSLLSLGAGFLVMLLGREQLTLHDRIAGTAVIYDWGSREAGMPSPLTRFIESH